MSTKLFDLLPSIYRIRDAEYAQSRTLLTAPEAAELATLQNSVLPLNPADEARLEDLSAKSTRGPLESILMVVDEQLSILADNMDQLYDDQFIETCAPWLVPYLGDLIGYQSVHGIAPAVASPRAEVAHTISFRRRKGTVLVMEQLARDVTGWGAHAVEFFLRLADTQYMNHIRPQAAYAPNLRTTSPHSIASAFDTTRHTIDVRRVAISRGKYNIQNIGIFLWSLHACSMTRTPLTAVAGAPNCFRLSTLNRDLLLFNLPTSQGADITGPATPANVPHRLTRRELCRDLALYYGENLSLVLFQSGSAVPATGIQICNLSGPDGSWQNLPTAAIAIDPELGRIALPPASPEVTATWHYGFNADTGGGEYPRATTFTGSPEQVLVRVPTEFPTIHEALASLAGDGIVEIEDSAVYTEADLTIAVKQNGHIELRAAEGARPTLLLASGITITGAPESILDLNGLLIASEAAMTLLTVPATDNALTQLNLTHITLVPGPIALEAALPNLAVTVKSSILGSILINPQSTLAATNSILDATGETAAAYAASIDPATNRPQPGGPLTLLGCTVIGKVYASLLTEVSNSILLASLSEADQEAAPPLWRAPLWSPRRQEGCVRFSYIPEASIVPTQFHCVEAARNTPAPVFYSLRYGDPGYAKLRPATGPVIRNGADDGGEMGAFHFLLAPPARRRSPHPPPRIHARRPGIRRVLPGLTAAPRNTGFERKLR